jgi:hypothetical protein
MLIVSLGNKAERQRTSAARKFIHTNNYFPICKWRIE